MHRYLLPLLIALVGLALTSPVAEAKPGGQGSCTRVTDPQTKTVEFRYLFQQTRQRLGNNDKGERWPVQVLKRKRGTLGTLTFKAAACLTPNHGWKLLEPQQLGYRSSRARANFGGVDNGEWQIGLADASEGRQTFIRMQMLACRHGYLFSGIKVFVGVVPLPQLKLASGIAKWAIGQAIPDDKLKCGDYGTVDMSVDVNAKGEIVVGPNTTNTIVNEYVKPPKDFELKWTYSITDPIIR